MPAGYLIADVEDSTPRWERDAGAMRAAMARTAALVEAAVARHGGRVDHVIGDEMFAIFEQGDVLGCALDIQRRMQAEPFEEVGGLALRIGVHAGPIGQAGAPDPVTANRTSRIAACAWGGQIVVSGDAREAFALPAGAWTEDFGAVRLRGVFSPIRLLGLLGEGLGRTIFPPLRSHSLEPVALPVATGPLIGRDADLSDILRALCERGVRHLTIVGPAGAGKTHLALAAAHALSEDRTAVFVALDPGGDNLQAALLRALSLPALLGVASDQQLMEFLRDKRALIVIDNAEAGASGDGFVNRMLDVCPGLVVLAASRAPMHGAHEELHLLQGLRCGSGDVASVAGSPAYQYFAHELRRIGGAHELDAASARLFEAISTRVSGSPLALRLAARWARVVPLADIASELAGSVDFLSSALQPHDGYDGLRAVFAKSWNLLNPGGQRLLACLSLNYGSFDYQDAQSICDCELAALTDLELRGLVERHGERLSLHPLIKEYARERLDLNVEEARRSALRHCQHYLARIRRAAGTERVSIINASYSDLRAAWTFAVEQESEIAWLAAEPLFYAFAAGFKFQEAAELFSTAAVDPGLSVRSMAFKANSLVQLGALGEARSLASAVLARARDPLSLAHAEQAIGNIEHIEGNYQAARAAYERARAWRENASDIRGLAYTHLALAVLAIVLSDNRAAQDNLERAHRAIQAAGVHELIQAARLAVADLALLEGRAEHADAVLNDALAAEPASAQHMCRALLRQAGVLTRHEQYPSARIRLIEAAAVADAAGDLRGKLMAFLELGRLDTRTGALLEAKATLLRACREALRLGAAPLLRQTLLALADAEAALGNLAEAARLTQAVTQASGLPAGELKQTTEQVMLAAERAELGLRPRPDAG